MSMTVGHPLEALRAEEVVAARELLAAAGLVSDSTRFSYVMLREPAKSAVLDFEQRRAGRPPREVTALLTDLATGRVVDTVTCLTTGRVVHQRVVDTAAEGWGPLLDEDFDRADAIVKKDPTWVAALERRGITDLSQIIAAPGTPGYFGYDDEVGRRVFRVLAFFRAHQGDLMWSHPVPGLVAHVAIDTGEVLRVVEGPTSRVPIPSVSGNYHDPQVRGPYRENLEPISITQPEGPSFSYADGVLTWDRWKVRVGFNGREGLTLHQISINDGVTDRPVVYRASVSEMVVNYGDPDPTQAWINYFDAGEFQFGRLANSLQLGCDCLGEILYLDVDVVDDFGNPQTIAKAICIHEEDTGILWKHTDNFAGIADTRRNRRLVISTFLTVGNYDYGFYWYLYLDGAIELEVKATGIVFMSGGEDGDNPHATPMAPGLRAPVHQHLFGIRLDMTVDGVANSVDEERVERMPVSPQNPWGNAFTRSRRRMRTERQARRIADVNQGTVWRISSADRTNRFGEPTSYVLYPQGKPLLAAADDSYIRPRAEFATHHLWVTRYARDELWAAGYTVNQNAGGAGLPAYVRDDRDIDGTDVVVWHTFGLTHFPRPEDWPVMPVDTAGFVLKPDGFFDRNPTLDVPPSPSANTCHSTSGTVSTDG
ncbi:primary-amine oxidase [Mycolicibacterium sp.]|uniref:primary-amine oxidase n=1 Tax=Mycolicibacterium sp. TaxID=2320850 RepID=UPI003D1090DA